MQTTESNTDHPAAASHFIRYGEPIAFAVAQHIAAAAAAEAQANDWPMVIAIADSAAQLVLLHKLDHAQLGSVAVAQDKARTAAQFKRPSKIFEDTLAAGGLGWRLLGTTGICPLDGGLPLLHRGRLVGAIGVSGMQSTQDAQVAAAGVRAFEAWAAAT